MPVTLVLVDWGLGLVIASFWPTSLLRRVDFPALGRPATATKPERDVRSVMGMGSMSFRRDGG
jgi:hypothetical protein